MDRAAWQVVTTAAPDRRAVGRPRAGLAGVRRGVVQRHRVRRGRPGRRHRRRPAEPGRLGPHRGREGRRSGRRSGRAPATPTSRSATASTPPPPPAWPPSSSRAGRSATTRSSPPPTSTASPWSSPANATSATRRGPGVPGLVQRPAGSLSGTMARIADLLAAGRTFSFEFFPPKTDAAQLTLGHTIAELEPLEPSFVSVTYGAGGSHPRAHPRGRHLDPPGDDHHADGPPHLHGPPARPRSPRSCGAYQRGGHREHPRPRR